MEAVEKWKMNLKKDRLIKLKKEKDFFRRTVVFLNDRNDKWENKEDQEPTNLKDRIIIVVG